MDFFLKNNLIFQAQLNIFDLLFFKNKSFDVNFNYLVKADWVCNLKIKSIHSNPYSYKQWALIKNDCVLLKFSGGEEM